MPGVPALLPEHAGLVDPVADLREACRAAVAWLVEPGEPVEVVAADGVSRRVGEHLLGDLGSADGSPGLEARRRGSSHLDHRGASHLDHRGASHLDHRAGGAWLVVGNGSARRTEKAPGHLHPAAHDFDVALDAALRAPDPAALAGIDEPLAAELWADVAGMRRLGELMGGPLDGAAVAGMDYAGDPFGVQYWVMRWTCAS